MFYGTKISGHYAGRDGDVDAKIVLRYGNADITSGRSGNGCIMFLDGNVKIIVGK
jgi:hypothetical protein